MQCKSNDGFYMKCNTRLKSVNLIRTNVYLLEYWKTLVILSHENKKTLGPFYYKKYF